MAPPKERKKEGKGKVIKGLGYPVICWWNYSLELLIYPRRFKKRVGGFEELMMGPEKKGEGKRLVV